VAVMHEVDYAVESSEARCACSAIRSLGGFALLLWEYLGGEAFGVGNGWGYWGWGFCYCLSYRVRA
jgi:hypothetical protein